MGLIIGCATEWDILYYLDKFEKQTAPKWSHPLTYLSGQYQPHKDTSWLHHYRLGHPAFSTLKIMFPSLFTNLDISKFHCDICELAKHKHAVFPPSNNKSPFPFDLIHSDIWGPSTILNIFGARWFVTFINDCTQVTWIFFSLNLNLM